MEDQRFYEHGGVDGIRVIGAVIKNLETGRRSEGGSTITQQLARQSFLSRDKTYRRKLKEVILAAYIEKMYGKKDILELYLNKVYLGDGLYGVEAASRGYFGKSSSDLTVDEAALLAGLIQSPSSYAPTVNLDRAIARRNVVLQTMVVVGRDRSGDGRAGETDPVQLKNALEIKETFGLYFKEQVRRELVERFGWQRVYRGGLRVFTTLDPDLQQEAEKLVEKALVDIERRPRFPHVPRAKQPPLQGRRARAVPAGRAGRDGSCDRLRARDGRRARLRREPLQPRGAGEAAGGLRVQAVRLCGGAGSRVFARRRSSRNLNDPIATPQGDWVPEDEHSTADSMTLRTALRTSSNRAAVQMLNTVGIPEGGRLRAEAERRNAAERPVARARRRAK